jgi:hypothetical protein
MDLVVHHPYNWACIQMTMTLALKPTKRHYTQLPTSVGLFYQHKELEAEWYERKPFALEIMWSVVTKQPFAGGMWKVDMLVTFDNQGEVSDIYKLEESVLCGPRRLGELTSKQIEFRRAHNMPMEADPFQGDKLIVHFEV